MWRIRNVFIRIPVLSLIWNRVWIILLINLYCQAEGQTKNLKFIPVPKFLPPSISFLSCCTRLCLQLFHVDNLIVNIRSPTRFESRSRFEENRGKNNRIWIQQNFTKRLILIRYTSVVDPDPHGSGSSKK